MKEPIRYLAISMILKYIASILYVALLPFIAMDRYIIVGLFGIGIIATGVGTIVYDWLFITRALKK